MAKVNAKCTNCSEEILIDDMHDAEICPVCNTAFVTEKALKLYNDTKADSQTKPAKKRNVLKSLGRALLMVLECLGYLIYVLCLMWLFFDVTGINKKKQ